MARGRTGEDISKERVAHQPGTLEEQSGRPEREGMGSSGLWKSPSGHGVANRYGSLEGVVMPRAAGSRSGWGRGEDRRIRGVLAGGLSCHRVPYGAAWALPSPLLPFHHHFVIIQNRSSCRSLRICIQIFTLPTGLSQNDQQHHE